ncbi:MAG: HigA family addiction module antitoxin [Thiobacillus sp.]
MWNPSGAKHGTNAQSSPSSAVLRESIPETLSVTQAAADLHVSRVFLSKILNGKSGISADMAIRLSQWLGTSPDVWIGMQPSTICGRRGSSSSRRFSPCSSRRLEVCDGIQGNRNG